MTRSAHKLSSAVAWFYDHAPEGWSIRIRREPRRTEIHCQCVIAGRAYGAARALALDELAERNLTDVVAGLVAELREAGHTVA